MWAVDFQFDETAGRRKFKLLNVVDEHTREALAIRVARNCTADDLVTIIEGLVAERGRADTSADGQRPRAHRLGAARLVPDARHDHQLH